MRTPDKVRAYPGLELLEFYCGKLITVAANERRIFFVGMDTYLGVPCVRVNLHPTEGPPTLNLAWTMPPTDEWDLRTLDGRKVDFGHG